MEKDRHSHLPWFRKYTPKKAADVEGQDSAVSEIRKFIQDFGRQKKKKALLLHGPTGTGKTASVYAVASETDLEVVEVNASDFRNEEGINSIIGNAIGQQSLFRRGKIILVDEVDGIAGTKDRGGLNAVIKLLEKTTFPIIMTANNVWDYKYNSLRSKCNLVEFQALQTASITNILKKIAGQEGLKVSEDILKSVSRMASGDGRAAINDLQTLASFTKDIDNLEYLGERNRQDTIINALMKILKSTDVNVAKGAFDNVDEDLEKCMLWLDENMPKEYTKPEDLANAYEMMSRASVFSGRVRRWQHWRFLVYVNDLLTVGVALAKKEKYHQVVQYKPTMKLLKIWQANQRYLKRKSIAAKIAEKTHTSSKVALQDTLPYLKVVFKRNKEQSSHLAGFLKLEKEEVDWLREK